jgi:hypothetical protein
MTYAIKSIKSKWLLIENKWKYLKIEWNLKQ